MPTGIVPRMIIQASRSSGVVTDRVRSDEKNPRTIRSQSRQKYAIIPIAVATCSPTTNARYGEPWRGHVERARPAAADQRREQHVVPQAGDREELGHALDEPGDDRLEVCEVVRHQLASLSGDPSVERPALSDPPQAGGRAKTSGKSPQPSR